MTCQLLPRALPPAAAHRSRRFAPLLVLLFGCAGPQQTEPEKVELPAWIAQGKQSWGDEKEGFFGIGTGEPQIENESLRASVAEERARATVLHEFEGWYVEWLKKSFSSAPEGSPEEASLESAIASLPTEAEAHVKIIERWIGPDGRTFALAHLRLDFMKDPQR